MTKDMTQGSPLKLILAFAVPLMLGSLFQQFYNLADTIIVGRFVGVEALAAVGSVGGLNYLVLGFVNGIACGFSIPISWTFGAHDHHEIHTPRTLVIPVGRSGPHRVEFGSAGRPAPTRSASPGRGVSRDGDRWRPGRCRTA